MKSFYERTQIERDTICNFYEFEANMLASDQADAHYMERMSEPNPYYATIIRWDDGKEVIETLKRLAVEMAYNKEA